MRTPAFIIAYLIVCFAQFFAIWDGMIYMLNMEGAFGYAIAFVLSVIASPIPIVGSILGIYGAVSVWDWHILFAALLFFWYVPVAIASWLFPYRSR